MISIHNSIVRIPQLKGLRLSLLSKEFISFISYIFFRHLNRVFHYENLNSNLRKIQPYHSFTSTWFGKSSSKALKSLIYHHAKYHLFSIFPLCLCRSSKGLSFRITRSTTFVLSRNSTAQIYNIYHATIILLF